MLCTLIVEYTVPDRNAIERVDNEIDALAGPSAQKKDSGFDGTTNTRTVRYHFESPADAEAANLRVDHKHFHGTVLASRLVEDPTAEAGMMPGW